jgi:hypothetical protein
MFIVVTRVYKEAIGRTLLNTDHIVRIDEVKKPYGVNARIIITKDYEKGIYVNEKISQLEELTERPSLDNEASYRNDESILF